MRIGEAVSEPREWSRSLGCVLSVAGAVLAATGCGETAAKAPEPADSPAKPGEQATALQPPAPATGPQATATPKRPLPAKAGGTLAVLADGRTAVASDQDRDRLFVADLQAGRLSSEITLPPGAEPGRIVEDADGRVHVVLRGAGEIVTLEGQGARVQIAARRPVCPAPRGMAYDRAADVLHVACAGGELVTLPAAGGAASRVRRVTPDLRDVVVVGDELLVSRFTSGEILRINADGLDVDRQHPRGASVAWRLLGRPGGGALLLHQRAGGFPLQINRPGGYSAPNGPGRCAPSAVESVVTSVRDDAVPSDLIAAPPLGLPLAIDLAQSRDGKRVAVLAAVPARPTESQVLVTGARRFTDPSSQAGCAGGPPPPRPTDAGVASGGQADGGAPPAPGDSDVLESRLTVSGDAVAVAFSGVGEIVIQTREPANLQIIGSDRRTIALSNQSRQDAGHTLFHTVTSLGIACASCHPEGGDDGLTWNFQPLGARRTPPLRGGLLGTEPFHWQGDMKDMHALATEVFTTRMGGGALTADQTRALGQWLDALAHVPTSPPVNAASAARGRALYLSADLACATCHPAPAYTNNQTVDVGTGRAFQVPSLRGVGSHPPYMHDGCATSLEARFRGLSACTGGDQHGKTSQLSDSEIDDLVAFLQSL